MHISEGILPAKVLVSGWAVTALIAGAALRKVEGEELPRMAVLTSVFFVASLIHVPIGPVSVHLILNGLVGVILGYGAYPSILLGLALQAILFQHGGVAVIGVNAVIMGAPAVLAYWIFGLRYVFPVRHGNALFGFAAGASATVLSGVILSLFLRSAGEAFIPAAKLALAAHIPVMLIEGAVTAAAVSYLARVKPEALARQHSPIRVPRS